jgi:hypothetical protein
MPPGENAVKSVLIITARAAKKSRMNTRRSNQKIDIPRQFLRLRSLRSLLSSEIRFSKASSFFSVSS